MKRVEQMTDHQERARIESELHAEGSNDPFAAAVRATRMPMIITDPKKTDNPIVFVNDAFTRLTGFGRGEILGRNCRFLQGPRTDQGEVAKIRDAIKRRLPVEVDLQNYKKDGELFWNRLLVAPVFDKDGELIYFLASQFDITDERDRLREVNEALRLNERTLDALIRSSSEVRYRLNADWTILYQLAGSNFIADTATANTNWVDEYMPPEDRQAVRDEFARAIRTKSTYLLEHKVNRVDGTVGWALSRAVPLFDDAGEIMEWMGAASDITDRKQAEFALRESEAQLRELNDSLEQRVAAASVERSKVEEQLRQSQKLEAVGQLTGGVAHDFNNLLTVIKSSADLLKRPDLSDERRTRYIAAISDTVDRAAKLTGQLLAFARRQTLKPEVFAACESVRAVSDMISTLAGSRIRIVTQLPDPAVFVNADPNQFDTALVNMAVNARDAMHGEGQLTVSVRPVEAMPAVRLHAARTGPFVAVSIADTGSGMAPDLLQRIFEPFFTTKDVGKGTGLGLSQVFGFAKQSGGDVTVESSLGKGTTFTLYLPRVDAEEDTINDLDIPKPLAAGHDTCVLVVEDNRDVGAFAVQSLTDLGYVTVLASNADEALAELAKGADRFHVVFTDVVMPGMNGIELAHEIRRRHHDLPVLLTSGYSHVLAQNGTYGFELLNKPYSVEELSGLLSKVATWRRRKQISGSNIS